MRFLTRAGRGSVVLAVGVACAAFAAPAAADIAPAGTVTAAPAVSRPGNAPAVRAPAPPSNVVINRPTMSMKAYRQAKAAATRAPQVAKARRQAERTVPRGDGRRLRGRQQGRF